MAGGYEFQFNLPPVSTVNSAPKQKIKKETKFMWTIRQLAFSLQADIKNYKETFDNLAANYEQRVAEINSTMIKGTQRYREEIEEVKKEHDISVSKLKAKFTKDATSDIESMRKQELEKIRRFDRAKVEELLALRSLPLTVDEMNVLADKYGSDYWCNRCMRMLCDENGIDSNEMCEPTLDVKLSVLNSLQSQFENTVRYYGDRSAERGERNKAKWLYLTDGVLQNAIQTFEGKSIYESVENSVDRAMALVRGRRTDSEKGLILGNLLRNAKGNKRNEILSLVKNDPTVSSFAIELSGYSMEINDFDAVGYNRAKQAISKIEASKDSTVIQSELDSVKDNVFLDSLIKVRGLNENLTKTDKGWIIKEQENTTETSEE